MKTKSVLALLFAVAATAMAAQSDWVATTTRDGSLTMSFPPSWMVADDQDPKFIEQRDKILAINPALKTSLQPGKNEDQVLQMFDMADSPDDGAMTNMNVQVKKNPGLTEKMYGEVGKQILASMPIKGKGEHKTVDLPFGKALYYSMTVEIKQSEEKSILMDMIGYLFVKGEKMYVVSFGAGAGQMKELKETVEKIMKTAKVS